MVDSNRSCMELWKHLMVFKIVSEIKPQWIFMALADDVASPCGGKYVSFENGLKKAAKINVCVQQPTLEVFD